MAKERLTEENWKVWSTCMGRGNRFGYGLSSMQEENIVKKWRSDIRPLFMRVGDDLLPFDLDDFFANIRKAQRAGEGGDGRVSAYYSTRELAHRTGTRTAEWVAWAKVVEGNIQAKKAPPHLISIGLDYHDPNVLRMALEAGEKIHKRSSLRLVSTSMACFFLGAFKRGWGKSLPETSYIRRLQEIAKLQGVMISMMPVVREDLDDLEDIVIAPSVVPVVKEDNKAPLRLISKKDSSTNRSSPEDQLAELLRKRDKLTAELQRIEREEKRLWALGATITGGEWDMSTGMWSSIVVTYLDGRTQGFRAITGTGQLGEKP